MQAFGQEVFMDPANPGTREFVWSKAKQNYRDKGTPVMRPFFYGFSADTVRPAGPKSAMPAES